MFVLPDLPYGYNALEPYIDEATMRLHHNKHHLAYVQKLNEALTGLNEFLELDIEELLKNIDKVPEDRQTKVKNHGGGHANHSLFWKTLKPQGGGEPTGEMASAIEKNFGDFGAFKMQFSESATNLFGSGWTWLVVEGEKLSIINRPNQDSPLMEGKKPILGLDVWEHAYYLKYQNRRAEYIEAWWNVVDWEEVTRRFQK